MALSKSHRLRSRSDFSLVYQKGDRHKSAHLTLRVLKRASIQSIKDLCEGAKPLCPSRFGIAIGLKVSKKATTRNRIKRQIRAILRQFLPRLAPGWDVVVVVHPQAVRCDYEQFLRELEQLLTKAEVINGRS